MYNPPKLLLKIREWMFNNRYQVFLASLLLFFLLPDILEGLLGIELDFMTLFSLVILSSIFLVHVSSRSFILQILLVIFMVIIAMLISRFGENRELNIILFLLLGLYFLSITVFLFRDLFNRKTVTWQIIVGAFTGYFLIGVLGFFLLTVIEKITPGSLTIKIESAKQLRDIFYFAFITMTTIGYGDITPASSSAKSAVILIGLFSQFYLAIVMAIMVGKFLSNPQDSENDG